MADTAAEAAPVYDQVAGESGGAGAIARPHFYDSINPGFIPAGALAACYGDGPFACNIRELTRFKGHILISDIPDNPQAARICRVLDIETGAARPRDAIGFIEDRQKFGYTNATLYFSLDFTPEVIRALDGHPIPRIWLAWWMGEPMTAAALSLTVKQKFGLDIPADRFWAHQYASGKRVDSSVLLGHDDFTR